MMNFVVGKWSCYDGCVGMKITHLTCDLDVGHFVGKMLAYHWKMFHERLDGCKKLHMTWSRSRKIPRVELAPSIFVTHYHFGTRMASRFSYSTSATLHRT